MNFSVDRDLPVPIKVQLKGLVEYGIACGELRAGEALPSVRDLAVQIGVAPMTVSQVYGELKAAGLIEARAGSGTFISNSEQARTAARPGTLQLRQRIDALIEDGLAMGMRTSELSALINGRLLYRANVEQRPTIVMIGVFPEATASYARFISKRLGDGATVEPMTIESVQQDPDAMARAASADLAVTFVNRHREVCGLLPSIKVVAISFIPSEETRRSLASLDPMIRLGVVSRFPDFLPIMKAGVQRFAPHVGEVTALILDTPDTEAAARTCDVVVYASGAESILGTLRADIPAIEYRHIPDPADIERILQPAIRKAGAVDDSKQKELS